MQVFSAKKVVFLRFISIVAVICLLCSSIETPACAVEVPDYGENIEDALSLVIPFYEFLGEGFVALMTDALWFPSWEATGDEESYYLNSFMDSSIWSCPLHAEAMGVRYAIHAWDQSSTRIRNNKCMYCGLLMGDFLDSFDDDYDDFVASLGGIKSLPLTLSDSCAESVDAALEAGTLLSCTYSDGSADFVIGKSAGSWSNAGAGAGGYTYQPRSDTLGEWYTDSFTVPSGGYYTITFPASSSSGISMSIFYIQRYYDGAWVNVGNTSSGYLIDTTGLLNAYSVEESSYSVGLVGGYEYRICASSSNDRPSCSYANGEYYYSGTPGYIHFAGPVRIASGSSSGTVYDPLDSEQAEDEKYSEDTRVALLMELIQQYNEKMAFQNNSDASNYFFGKVDEDGNLEGYYTPSVFNETSKIFTEPVSGMQYQTTGWTYDYETRTYDMFLDPGTFVLQGSDVIRIICTYGDDSVTISYIHPDGVVAQVDEYAYVMVASNECALNGHTYSTEITKEPTCTSVGQQTSTCSVCGDQKTEQIPMNEHTSTYSVFKEPSCSDSGIALYTCAVCGTQYSEMIDALGHDWISTETVETVYELPPGTSCPDCAAEDFTYELDKETALYTCTCSCGASWTVDADVTEGYTKYSCNRCGATKTEYDREDGDGLFNSVGNFIADGITWCTEKLSQLVDSITSIVDTFNGYLDTLEGSGGAFPGLIGALIGLLPEELMVIVWVSIIGFVALAVWKGWLG